MRQKRTENGRLRVLFVRCVRACPTCHPLSLFSSLAHRVHPPIHTCNHRLVYRSGAASAGAERWRGGRSRTRRGAGGGRSGVRARSRRLASSARTPESARARTRRRRIWQARAELWRGEGVLAGRGWSSDISSWRGGARGPSSLPHRRELAVAGRAGAVERERGRHGRTHGRAAASAAGHDGARLRALRSRSRAAASSSSAGVAAGRRQPGGVARRGRRARCVEGCWCCRTRRRAGTTAEGAASSAATGRNC